MISGTLRECRNRNYKKIGLMATEGTINTKIYEKFNDCELELFIPKENIQKIITSFIYDYVKKDKKVNREDFINVLNYFYDNGCDGIILGCTELSVIYKELDLINNYNIVDSTTVVAKLTVSIAGKKLKVE